MDLRFMIHPHGCNYCIVNVATTGQEIYGVPQRITYVRFGSAAVAGHPIIQPSTLPMQNQQVERGNAYEQAQ
jgi:hypothetical protein